MGVRVAVRAHCGLCVDQYRTQPVLWNTSVLRAQSCAIGTERGARSRSKQFEGHASVGRAST